MTLVAFTLSSDTAFALAIWASALTLLIGGSALAIFLPRWADADLTRILGACQKGSIPYEDCGTVRIRFHVYSGFLVFVKQALVEADVPHARTHTVLKLLHKHNIKYGFLAYGAPLVPILSYLNYRRELSQHLRSTEHKG